jgi:hypothetical protein
MIISGTYKNMHVSTSQKLCIVAKSKNELCLFKGYFLKHFPKFHPKSRGKIVKFTKFKLCDPTCNN